MHAAVSSLAHHEAVRRVPADDRERGEPGDDRDEPRVALWHTASVSIHSRGEGDGDARRPPAQGRAHSCPRGLHARMKWASAAA